MNKHPFLKLFLLFVSIQLSAQTGISLQRSTPEAEGLSSEVITSFIGALEQEIDAPHSLMIVKNGKVVTEAWWDPYNAQTPHELWSLSKSFTSTAIGFAVQEGLLSIDDLVISFFPDKIPENPDWQLKQLRVKDLLTMTTGHNKEPFPADTDDDWVKTFLDSELPYLPGTHFMYNTPATYMLSAIIHKISGEKLIDYLYPRLFEPLQIEKPQWEMDPKGINTGGWGLHLKTEDIAKFGQFYLQKGKWNGSQLLSQDWITMATSKQVSNGSNPDNDWMQGYGFQFWRSRYNTYRGDGAMGQFCLVFPDQDTVVAITSGTNNMGEIMQLTWDIILPVLKEGKIPRNDQALLALQKKIASLKIKAVEGQMTNRQQKKWLNKEFHFDENDQGIKTISFKTQNKEYSVQIKMEGGIQIIPFGQQRYIKAKVKGHLPYSRTRRSSFIPESSLRYIKNKTIASNGAWTDENEFHLRVYLYETPARMNYKFKFSDDGLILECTADHYLGFGDQPKTLKSI
ncbi:MAG: serine hydrolase [Flavobacteriaceae bacterium]|jgi:CubicO group peptidase (beta-lactamase class C family)|nr:serine hydrolase [Flavobacteriaceae bacterium]